jgi:hypothetical protein
MGEHPERLLADSREMAANYHTHQRLLAAKGFPNMVKRYEALRATDQRLQLLHVTH